MPSMLSLYHMHLTLVPGIVDWDISPSTLLSTTSERGRSSGAALRGRHRCARARRGDADVGRRVDRLVPDMLGADISDLLTING